MKLSSLKIGFLGFGNMGQAFCQSLLQITDVTNLYACDHNQEKFVKFPGINVCTNSLEVIQKSDVVIVAVKPQSFEVLVAECSAESFKGKFVISIMAGIPLKTVQAGFPQAKVVRAMPNISVKVGYGVTGWYCEKDFTNDERNMVKAIFGCSGFEIELQQEEMIHNITALSGSGPAYFYYFAEIIAKAGVELGLEKTQAEELAKNTFIGAAKLLEAEKSDLASLRQAVTSKGGTTEAALKSFDENGLAQTVTNGIMKAKDRSIELSK